MTLPANPPADASTIAPAAALAQAAVSSRHPALPDGPVRRILMVCLGNVCRSPTAEAVLRHQLRNLGLGTQVVVDSAGTNAGMIGAPPDERSIAHAARRGYDLAGLRARRVAAADFTGFDLLVAMDTSNVESLRQRCPADRKARIVKLLDFLPSAASAAHDVPDPYYGGPAGFERVLDLIEAGCEALATALAGATADGAARASED